MTSYDNEAKYIAEQEALKEQGEQQFYDELIAKDDNDWSVPIDGALVTKTQLIRAWRFYKENQITRSTTYCPLCGCDFEDNGLFVCQECGELCEKEERCEHHTYDVCQNCCDTCRSEQAESDEIALRVDELRGK